jgi:hypothetical protein
MMRLISRWDSWVLLRLHRVRLLDEVSNIKDRILNVPSQAGGARIYSKETQDAVKVIQMGNPA